VVFNGHGGNTQHLREVLFRVYSEIGIRCASIDWWVLESDLSSEIFGRTGGHGGIEELSLVYMAYPEVKISGKYPAYHPKDGVFAYPSPRSILLYREGEYEDYDIDEEKMKEFANRIIKKIEEVLSEILRGWESLAGK
jgi:Creatinine amidohydrolase.